MKPMEVEPLLIDRLRNTVSGVRSVTTIGERADVVSAKSQVSPALIVMWDGYVVPQRQYHGITTAQMSERWLVIPKVRFSGQGDDAALELRQSAIPFVNAVFGALLGWQPEGTEAFALAPAPRPGMLAGFGYFPLAFQWNVFAQGETNDH